MPQQKVGVLALQGDFAKHIQMLQNLDVSTKEVRTPKDLSECRGLIIPGGESTVILRQIHYIQLEAPLQKFAKQNPIFGTCAGLILMSKEILGDNMGPFGWIDATIERNAYGRQYESFHAQIAVKLPGTKLKDVSGLFIRAPRIRKYGSEVKVLAEYEGEPVLIQQESFLGATFHTELTGDDTLHRYFLEMIQNSA